MLVLFTSHRVEMLPHFEDVAKDYDVVVVEEPRDERFERMLKGEITVDEYVRTLDTSFPIYSKHQCEVLRRLYGMGKKILQIDPYLETIERIREAVERGELDKIKDERVELVQRTEREANLAWLDYNEAFLRRDFDELVDATVRFTKADAERFKVRDRMRAEEIAESVDGDVLVEAGQIHILLPRFLEEMGFEVSTINLPETIARRLGIELYPNPGNELTKRFMLGEDVDEEEARLMAARGIIYISLVPKEEMLPTEEKPYPHLVEENKIAKAVSKLSYEGCKRLFYKIWS